MADIQNLISLALSDGPCYHWDNIQLKYWSSDTGMKRNINQIYVKKLNLSFSSRESYF